MAFTHHNQLNIPHAGRHGFWGIVTSTVDWCEENYIVSHHIAEFWNSISNLLMGLYCLLGISFVVKFGMKLRYALAFSCFGLVGLGSFLFHGTLKYSMQLLDELPMLFGIAFFLFCQIGMFPRKDANETHQILFFLGYTGISTIAYLFSVNATLFHAAFGIMAVITSLLPLFHIRRARSFIGNKKADLILVHLKRSLVCFLLGFALWKLENVFCTVVRPLRDTIGYPWRVFLELHSWWHILSGYAIYTQATCSLYLRLLLLGCRNAELTSTWLGPYLKRK